MYCGNCGNQLADGAAFCPACGTPVQRAREPETTAEGAATFAREVPEASATPAETASAGTAAEHKRKVPARIIVICAIAAISIIGITIGLVVNHAMQAKRTPHPISFTIQADGYNDQCTKIPVSVKGVDFEGNQVDDVAFVDASGNGVELVRGEYDLSFPASPLTPDGVLYNVPTNTYHVALGEDLEEGAPFVQQDQTPAVFTKSTALDETDEMITSAYNYAIMDESQADRAEELRAAAVRVHGDAVAIEEQRKANEAARTVDMQYYTLKLPEYWVNKVDVIRNGNNVQIVPKGYGTDYTILSIRLVPSSETINAGDYMGGMLKYVETSGGRAEMWGTRYPGAVHGLSNSSRMSRDALAAAIDLQTGGAYTLEKIESDHSGNQGELSMKYAMIAADWLEANVELIAK